jgi:hypothetical protein
MGTAATTTPAGRPRSRLDRAARVSAAYVAAVGYAVLVLMLVPAIWTSYPQALLDTIRTQPYLLVSAVGITTLAFVLCHLNTRFAWFFAWIIIGAHGAGIVLALKGLPLP